MRRWMPHSRHLTPGNGCRPENAKMPPILRSRGEIAVRSKPLWRRRPATLHGVVFDILVGAGCPAVARGPEARLRYDVDCRAEAGVASEGWWARQDSNLQPDRYERPALTIELQAPPRSGRGERPATVPPSFTGMTAIRQWRVGG